MATSRHMAAWSHHDVYRGSLLEDTYGGEDSGTSTSRLYPTLQALDSDEIPTAATAPTVAASSNAVANAAQLQNMSGANTYYLTADIDLTGVTWTPITGFSGVLDGQGYTISNLTIDAAASSDQGLFGTTTSGARIYNLSMRDCSVTGDDDVGILIGSATGSITIYNVTIINPTLVGDAWIGALIGYASNITDGDIYGCTVQDATITYNESDVGLVFGDLSMSTTATDSLYVTNCSASGTLTRGSSYTSDELVGGFAGLLDGDITPTPDALIVLHSCSVDVTIVTTDNTNPCQMGGFVGYAKYCLFYSCTASGSIDITCTGSPTCFANGGFVGFQGSNTSGEVYIDCGTSVSVSIDAGSPSVSGDVYLTGGFVGKWDAQDITLTRCYATGDITVSGLNTNASWYAIGGFAGGILHGGLPATDVIINRCWATGDVTLNHDSTPATVYKGGLGGFAGGIHHFSSVAQNAGVQINNCYAWGSVSMTTVLGTSDSALGGFIGSGAVTPGGSNTMAVSITNCYAAQTNTAAGSDLTGQLGTSTYTRGLVGWINDDQTYTVSNTFWDTVTSGTALDDNATGHITDWMQTKSNYEDAGWDFDDIWYAEDDTTWDYSWETNGTGLGVNSVAVIPSTDEDEVWVVVSRLIDGEKVWYLEQMQPREVDDQEDEWFVDSGVSYDSSATTTITGLDHLEGEEVYILADGAVHPPQTVASGSITLAESASRVIVGLPFRYILKPMRLDLEVGGTTQGSLKKFAEVVLDFIKSANVWYGVDVDTLYGIDFRTTEAYGVPPALFTGEKVIIHDGGFDAEDAFIVTGNDPLPCTVRAIIPRIKSLGR